MSSGVVVEKRLLTPTCLCILSSLYVNEYSSKICFMFLFTEPTFDRSSPHITSANIGLVPDLEQKRKKLKGS